MDYAPLLASLCSMLQARLAFRKAPLVANLQNLMAHATKTGNRQSSGTGFALAQIHEQEMYARAELITNELRQARSSWSPKQIVDSQKELKLKITDLFKANISQAAYLAAQIGGFHILGNQPTHIQMTASFMQYSDEASKVAVSMVEAAIEEIVAAAANDLVAHGPTERPSHLYQNTFHGPVASVAQGGSSVGNVNQEFESATPQQIAEVVATIINAMPTGQGANAAIEEAKSDLQAVEYELQAGKLPLKLLQRGFGLLGKIEDIAIRAPAAMDHIQRLGAMLGLS